MMSRPPNSLPTLGIQDPESTFPAQECEVGSSLHLGPNSLLKMIELSEITNPYVACLLMVGILEGGTMCVWGVSESRLQSPGSLQGPVSSRCNKFGSMS